MPPVEPGFGGPGSACSPSCSFQAHRNGQPSAVTLLPWNHRRWSSAESSKQSRMARQMSPQSSPMRLAAGSGRLSEPPQQQLQHSFCCGHWHASAAGLSPSPIWCIVTASRRGGGSAVTLTSLSSAQPGPAVSTVVPSVPLLAHYGWLPILIASAPVDKPAARANCHA